MELFKSELVTVLGNEFVLFFNIEYLYEAIGEDFNDLFFLFRSWKFEHSDLTVLFKKRFCYPNHKSVLSKKLVSFNNKFSSCLPNIYTRLIRCITFHLMKILYSKIKDSLQGDVIFTNYSNTSTHTYFVSKPHPIMCKNNEELCIIIGRNKLRKTRRVWQYLCDLYDSKLQTNNLQSRTMMQRSGTTMRIPAPIKLQLIASQLTISYMQLTLEKIVTSCNLKIMKCVLMSSFDEDIHALNIDYVCEDLDSVFAYIIIEIRKKILTILANDSILDVPDVKKQHCRLGFSEENL